MALLPAVGTITYNGYTFNAATKTTVSGRPVYDEAGRTIVAVVYTFYLTSFVPEAVSGAGADSMIADLRQRLMSPGRSFTYTGQGLGNLEINVAGTKDVLWGPKPTALDLEPLGSKALWRITWACEIAIPECSNAVYQFQPMAFNYQTTFEIDADGYSVRTVAGYLEIPMTRTGDGARNVPDSADKYRERIILPIPEGFRRVNQNFSVSFDRRRLTFTFVDEELPSEGLPIGCTSANGMHVLTSAQAGTVRNWTGRISATYVVAKGLDRKLAYEAFFALVEDRLKAARDAVKNDDDTKDSVVPYSMEITQGLYQDGRRISFSMSYTFVLPLKKILEGSGIWREVPKTDSRQWATSIEGVTGVRGFANLKDRPENDAIVDLCGSTSLSTVPTDPKPPVIRTPPKPELKHGGYVAYANAIDIEEIPGTSSMRSLPKQQTAEMKNSLTYGSFSTLEAQTEPGPELGVSSSPGPRPSGTRLAYDLLTGRADGLNNVLGNLTSPSQPPQFPNVRPGASGGTVPQLRSAPEYTVRLRGYAVTLGIAPECPSLEKFEDATLIPHPIEQPRFTVTTIGFLLGMPLTHAEWVIPYRASYPDGARRRP